MSVRVQILGSGDAFGSGGRHQTCILVDFHDTRCLIDCGSSAIVAMRSQGVEPGERSFQLNRPEGCAGCNYTGYRGRIGIFELMQVDDKIRAMVSQSVDSKQIKSQAIRSGMHPLRADGARKVLAGLTSVAEVLRATEEEAAVAQI